MTNPQPPMIRDIRHERMVIIFNVWLNRYLANPSEFDTYTDSNGNTYSDYGEQCVCYFDKIADELDHDGLLPTPQRF